MFGVIPLEYPKLELLSHRKEKGCIIVKTSVSHYGHVVEREFIFDGDWFFYPSFRRVDPMMLSDLEMFRRRIEWGSRPATIQMENHDREVEL